MTVEVLIVGTSPNGSLSREILDRAGFAVSVSSDFEEATARISESPPHAILVESTTDPDGAFIFAQRVGVYSRRMEIPILILSAGNEPPRCQEGPYVSRIPEPSTPFALLRELAHLTRPKGVSGYPA